MKINYLFCFLLIVGLGCTSEKSDSKNDIWKNTQKIELDQERINLKIPVGFEKSSRYRIKEDLPFLKQSPDVLTYVQNNLAEMEFEDAEIDVYIDKSFPLRMVTIMNVERINFSKVDGAVIHTKIKKQHQASKELNPMLQFEKIDSKHKNTNKLKMLKYKYRITNGNEGNQLVQTLYYLTTPVQSLIIYEYSNNMEDIEDYLWSVKD